LPRTAPVDGQGQHSGRGRSAPSGAHDGEGRRRLGYEASNAEATEQCGYEGSTVRYKHHLRPPRSSLSPVVCEAVKYALPAGERSAVIALNHFQVSPQHPDRSTSAPTPTRGSGGRTWTSPGRRGEAPRQRPVLSPALSDFGGRCSEVFASSAVTLARTASRAASGILMPATSTTAWASNSMRSAEIASHFASHLETTC